MNKIAGIALLVIGVLLVFLFLSTAFMHGYASGMRRLGQDPTQLLFAGGAAVCLIGGVVSLLRKSG